MSAEQDLRDAGIPSPEELIKTEVRMNVVGNILMITCLVSVMGTLIRPMWLGIVVGLVAWPIISYVIRRILA